MALGRKPTNAICPHPSEGTAQRLNKPVHIHIHMHIILTLFLVYSVWQQQDFQFREMFVPKDNWLHKAFAVQKDYFIGDASPVGVYTKAAPEVSDQ